MRCGHLAYLKWLPERVVGFFSVSNCPQRVLTNNECVQEAHNAFCAFSVKKIAKTRYGLSKIPRTCSGIIFLPERILGIFFFAQ